MPRRSFHVDEEGQTVVLVGIVLLALLFAVGLAIDSGQLFTGKRSAQEAADAGAFAGAAVLFQGGTVAQAVAAAAGDVRLNGYAADVPTQSTTVTVNDPPVSGAYAGNGLCVEVIVASPVRTALVPQQASFTNVRARGVGCSVSVNNGDAVIALDQACTPGALNVSPQGQLEVAGGNIQINSCSATAGSNSGNLNLHAPYVTDVVGNVNGPGWNARIGRSVTPDPFAGLARPSTNGVPSQVASCLRTNQPGIYTAGFTSNCDYQLAAGTYILAGGGVSLAGNSSLTGAGVMFYLTNANYPAAGGACATMALNGNNHTQLSAPTSGTYSGMLIWQDVACSGMMSIGGNGQIDGIGSIYVPGATIQGQGSNAQVTCSQIVAKNFDVQSAHFHVTYSSGSTYQGRRPALVE